MRIQPLGPCAFTYVGRWFGSTGYVYEIGEEAGRLIWSAPEIDERATLGCEGPVVWASWAGPRGEGRANARAEGQAGGPATRLRWSNGVVFWRVPDLTVRSDTAAVSRGDPVVFVGEIAPPDIPDVSYVINFGDQTEAPCQGPRASHVYSSAGEFDVVLAAVINERRFSSRPFRIQVSEPQLEQPTTTLLLEADRREALVGEHVTLRAVLSPGPPAAEYQFEFAGRRSPRLLSPQYDFRCETEGTWTARAVARVRGERAQFIYSEPVEINVRRPPPDKDKDRFLWLIPAAVVGAALIHRKLRRKKREREEAEMKRRVTFEGSFDSGVQRLGQPREARGGYELQFRPRLDAGRQRVDRLAVTEERSR
jgi:hypothetical protein